MASHLGFLSSVTLSSLVAFALYCHNPDNLNGAWILDDRGTITVNPTVLPLLIRRLMTQLILRCIDAAKG
jgi:hypothetical protein